MVRHRVFWTILLSVLLLMGCGQSAKDSPDPSQEKEVSFRYPLTGLPTEKEASNRAISVMINNHPSARPHSGIDKADIVYEVLVEGGYTRLLAVYHSEIPDTIGSIRSARPYFVELAKGFDSIYVHHGWSEDAKTMIQNGAVDSINGLDYDGTLFKRVSFRKKPHNSYITYDNIEKGANQNNISLTGSPRPYRFLTKDEEVAGTEHPAVSIFYGIKPFNIDYSYEPTKEVYYRFQGNAKTVDYETNQPVLLANILIVEATHTKIDQVGRLNIDLTSGGKALLIQKGKVQELEWENVNGVIVPFLNGEEQPLVPGKTWINIVPDINTMVQYK